MIGRRKAVKLARSTASSASSRPLDALRYTPPQLAYLSDPSPIALLRGGNQIGKTMSVHADLVHTARGTHPFQATPPPPVNIIVLSESWEQMGRAGGFMQKLWDLIPKGEIDPKIRFEPGRGITGKPPRISFVSGPGKGSIISFGTYRQGAAPMAGATVHRVYLDEPPTQAIYNEIVPRLLRHRGKMRIVFTPVENMPDMRWLRKLVDDGQISEHNPHLCEASCWPEGAPVPWLDQGEIDRVAATWPEAFRKMRIEGAWEPVMTDRWLTNFSKKLHVRASRPAAGSMLCVGLDHGTNAGKQTAALVAIQGPHSLKPRVWVIDERVSDGMSTPGQDAADIHAMLDAHGYGWADVDMWVGDRPIAGQYRLTRKSNSLLRKHLAFQAGVPLGQFPVLNTPMKWAGSVEHGLWLMNAMLGEVDDDGPYMHIHPRCERFIEFCDKFNGNRHDPLKDVGDAVRYPLEKAINEIPAMRLVARY